MLTEAGKKLLEYVGHPVPAGTHVEHKALGFELARAAARHRILLQQSDREARFGQVAGGGQSRESRPDYDRFTLQVG